MPSHVSLCFYCRTRIDRLDYVQVSHVEQGDHGRRLHRYHPICYTLLTEPVAQIRVDFNRMLEEMTRAYSALH